MHACYICVFIIYYLLWLKLMYIWRGGTPSPSVLLFTHLPNPIHGQAASTCANPIEYRVCLMLIVCEIFSIFLCTLLLRWLWKCSPFRSGSCLLHRWWCYPLLLLVLAVEDIEYIAAGTFIAYSLPHHNSRSTYDMIETISSASLLLDCVLLLFSFESVYADTVYTQQHAR